MSLPDVPAPTTQRQNPWVLGQRLIGVSARLAAQPHFSLLRDSVGSNAEFLVMPPVLTVLENQTLARAAHEIWMLQDDAAQSASVEQMVSYRTQSIPVSAGERRSLLHAPELGVVRIFRLTPEGTLAPHEVLLPFGETEVSLKAAWDNMCLFAGRIASMDETASLQVDLTPDRGVVGLPGIEIERVVAAAIASADFDERRVRWVLASLFTVTVVGVILLQILAMAGWSVPMADIYAVFFMLVGSGYFWVREHHLNDRQLVYRLIAQTLEIHLVWRRAGLQEPVAAQFQLRHHASLKWVRELLRFAFLQSSLTNQPASSRSVLERWLPLAISTNDKLANWHASRARRMSLAVRWCYGFSGLLTLLMVCGPKLTGWTDLAVGATLGIASSIGTLFLIFGGTLGYSADAQLHQHLVRLLRRTQEALALDLPDHEYDELLLDAGRECIQAAAERAFN
jgi:hypothetical protein